MRVSYLAMRVVLGSLMMGAVLSAETARAAPARSKPGMSWDGTDWAALPRMEGVEWHVKAAHRDPGHWLAFCASEHAPWLDVAWDWYRSPTDIETFRKMGLDLLAQRLTNDHELAAKRETMTRITGPGEVARRDRFRLEWVERTGLGLAPVTFIHPSQGGPDGYVRPGGGQRLGPGWYEICFSSPRTARWTARKILGMRHDLRSVLVPWHGKDLVMWGKEVLTWLYPYYDRKGKGPLVLKGCYGPYCVQEFRSWLAARYGAPAAMNQDIGTHFSSFGAVDPPLITERIEKPGLFWLWMKYRDWAYVHTGVQLPEKLRAANLDSNGTYAFSSHADGIWRCMDAQMTTEEASIINLHLGDLSGASRMLYAMVDPILRRSPEKAAMGFYGGGTMYYRKDPRFIKRALAQAAARVSRVRGMGFMWWDAMPRSREAYRWSSARYFPAVCESMAWWNHFGELQADLLKDAVTPAPEVCVYFPRSSAWFAPICPPEVAWRRWIHDRRTWNHCEVFLDFDRRQIPVDCLLPDAVERGDLSRYRVAYVLYGPRNTRKCLEALVKFHRRGGYVFGAYDALTWNMVEESHRAFEEIFQATPLHVYAGATGWAKPEEKEARRGLYTITASHPALPPVGTRVPTLNGIMTVTPKGAKVYATYRGEPCIVGAEHSLFVGSDLVTDLALMRRGQKVAVVNGQARDTSKDEALVQQVLLGFADYAKVGRPLRVESKGEYPPRGVSAGLLVDQPNGRSLIIVSNSERAAVPLSFRVQMPEGTALWNLIEGKRLPETNGRFETIVPAREVRVFLAADSETAEAGIERQRRVEERSGVFDWYASRYFFTRKKESGGGEAWYPEKNFSDIYYRIPDLPHATLVTANSPPAEDQAAARRIQAMVRDYPIMETFHWKRDRDKGLNPRKVVGVELPIARLSQVSPKLLESQNLMILCNSENRKIFAKRLGIASPEVQVPAIRMQQRNSWREGGNVLWLIAGPGDRASQIEEFRKWLWTWFDGLNGPVPNDLLKKALEERLMARGPLVKRPSGLWIAGKPGRREYYRPGPNEGTSLPNDWIRRATLGRERPAPQGLEETTISIFEDDFTWESPHELGPPDWRVYLPGNYQRRILTGFGLGQGSDAGWLVTSPKKKRWRAAVHLGPACPVLVQARIRFSDGWAGLLVGDFALLTDGKSAARLVQLQRSWGMKTLAETRLERVPGPNGAEVVVWSRGGKLRAAIRDGKPGQVLASLNTAAVPQADETGQIPYGVLAGSGQAAFDEFTVRTNEAWLNR